MGDYSGVYVLEEKVKRDGNRVDIDVLQPEQTNSATISGGYLLKVDRTDGNERTFTGGGMTINYQEPDGLEMVTPARAPQACRSAMTRMAPTRTASRAWKPRWVAAPGRAPRGSRGGWKNKPPHPGRGS